MNKEILFRRNGDVNLHPISKEEFEKVSGQIIKHTGSFVVARGEATGSEHRISVKEKENLVVKQDEQGNFYFAIMEGGLITHTHDHKTLTIPKKTYYRQVQEREVDHFADSVIRKVVD